MADTQKKSTKKLTVITYAIALVCLLAGLLLPNNFDFKASWNAVIVQIPNALERIGIKFMDGIDLVHSYPVNLWGNTAFELGGLFVLLYALVCVIAVIGLFIVIFGNKEKDTSLKCAGFIEVLAIIVLTVLLCMEMMNISKNGYGNGNGWSLELVIAFGGPLLMLIIQSIAGKGASGVAKMFLTVFSGLTVVLCLFSFTAIIPQLADMLKGVLGENTQILGWTTDGESLGSVWYHLDIPFNQNYGDFLNGLGVWDKIVSVCMLVLGALIIVNFLLDVCGLEKTTKRWMLGANLIRYILEVVLVLAVIIIGRLACGHDVGMLSYALIALVVLSVVINIFRFISYKDHKEQKAKAKSAKTQADAETAAAEAMPAQTPAPQPQAKAANTEQQKQAAPVADTKPNQPEAAQSKTQAPAQQPKPAAKPASQQSDGVYSPVIYSGPRDEFIDTLSNEERVEFARTFIERKNGDIQGVPEYKLDGDNDKFFQSLFIYYSRVRGLVSDGLMSKFYEKLSAIKR